MQLAGNPIQARLEIANFARAPSGRDQREDCRQESHSFQFHRFANVTAVTRSRKVRPWDRCDGDSMLRKLSRRVMQRNPRSTQYEIRQMQLKRWSNRHARLPAYLDAKAVARIMPRTKTGLSSPSNLRTLGRPRGAALNILNESILRDRRFLSIRHRTLPNN